MENRNSKISYTKENCLSPLKFPSEFNAKPNNHHSTTIRSYNLPISLRRKSGRFNTCPSNEKEKEKKEKKTRVTFENSNPSRSTRFTEETPSSDTSVATSRNYGLRNDVYYSAASPSPLETVLCTCDRNATVLTRRSYEILENLENCSLSFLRTRSTLKLSK